MAQRDLLPRIGVVLGLVCVALAFSWPLPLHLSTAFTGDPGGDTGVYVWNQWVFQHELINGRNPLRTDRILSLGTPVELAQHNYTIFLNVLALPLLGALGVVTTFNLVFLAANVLTALCTYALARRVTAATRLEAWLAGIAFAWSPVLVARSTGHFSLVIAAPLAAFLLCLISAEQSRRLRDAALAGACVAWAAFCDPYLAVFCVLLAAGYLLRHVVAVRFDTTPGPRRADCARWGGAATHVAVRVTLNLLLAVVGGLVAGVAIGGGRQVAVGGLDISVRSLYTPVAVLTLLLLLRLALVHRPHLSRSPWTWSTAQGRALLVAGLACVGPLAPVLYGLGQRYVDGSLVRPPTLWRSSPPGVDALGFVTFNPHHLLARALAAGPPAASVIEYTASLSIVCLAVVAVACWRAGYRPSRGWLLMTIGFALLSLGPFIHIAGVNTHVPGPWALLRYVPVIDTVRTPTRFAIVAALGVAILLAAALAALGRRFPAQRRAIAVTCGLLLGAELTPAPRVLHSAQVPTPYQTIAADPRPVRVLELPFGVRDGTFAEGDFSAHSLFYQTMHGKRLVGGYLSRISQRRMRGVRAERTLRALVKMSDGEPLSARSALRFRSRATKFLARSDLGYVVVDRRRMPAGMEDFVRDAWGLQLIASEDHVRLYRTPDRP